jgi:DNA-binding response OmpR family regulator
VNEEVPEDAMRHNKKILLVDDSRTSLFLAQMILKRGPYRIVTASDGAEGVEKAVAERPDLILMDVVMPRLNGFEALQKLRERDETRTTPVIFVTTRGEPINVETGLGEGGNDYVTKPIDAEELLSKVKGYLGA